MKLLIARALAVLLVVAPGVHANEAAAWNAWREGRAVLLMRHALAPGTGDPVGHDLDDCATQRNLSDSGRDQARKAGQLIAGHIGEQGATSSTTGVDAPTPDTVEVFSSAWCRCMDTGRLLGLGEPEVLPSLNSFFNDLARRQPQTQELRAWLDERFADDDALPAILVSHQVNIAALIGRGTSSGEFHIVDMADGQPRVLASVTTPVP